MKNRLKISLLLMVLTIASITAFQLWWLSKSYMEESSTLRMRTGISFREALQELQVSKLKLDSNFHGTIDVRRNAIGMVNVLKDQFRDSLKRFPEMHSAMFVAMDKNNLRYQDNSITSKTIVRYGPPEIFDVLISSDSLQDSLTLPEIVNKYKTVLIGQNLNVPFSVVRLQHSPRTNDFIGPDNPDVTIGFAHPVTYRLILNNNFPYLIKKISPQILFSLFLLAVTVIAFLSLYRNLMAQKKLAGIKNDFISNITHELKTPIATVSVAIEAMKNFNALDDPSRTSEYLDISEKELQRLTLLVDKVLKLSMFEKKQIRLKLEQINLNALVEEITSSMKLQIEKCRAKVNIRSVGNTEITGDRLHLVSVIYNLIDNALKYSREDPVIHIDINELAGYVGLTVTDNGIGIAPEYRQKIFEKFFRVPSGDTHNAKGYGLGLSYAAYVVKLHRGEIELESNEGIGSRFTIKIPKSNG